MIPLKLVAPVGLEPTTLSLKGIYSRPIELQGHYKLNFLKVVLPPGLEPGRCAYQAHGLHYRIGV